MSAVELVDIAGNLTNKAFREDLPAVLARGFPYARREASTQELLRPRGEDLFR